MNRVSRICCEKSSTVRFIYAESDGWESGNRVVFTYSQQAKVWGSLKALHLHMHIYKHYLLLHRTEECKVYRAASGARSFRELL